MDAVLGAAGWQGLLTSMGKRAGHLAASTSASMSILGPPKLLSLGLSDHMGSQSPDWLDWPRRGHVAPGNQQQLSSAPPW